MAKPKNEEQKPKNEEQDFKGLSKFRANWRLDGLPSGPLGPGDVVELTEDVAASLVESGVLSPVEDTEGDA